MPYYLTINAMLDLVGKPQISLLSQSAASITTTWLQGARVRMGNPRIYTQTWLGNSICAEVIRAKIVSKTLNYVNEVFISGLEKKCRKFIVADASYTGCKYTLFADDEASYIT